MYSLSQEASLTHMRLGMSMAIWRHSLQEGLETGEHLLENISCSAGEHLSWSNPCK